MMVEGETLQINLFWDTLGIRFTKNTTKIIDIFCTYIFLCETYDTTKKGVLEIQKQLSRETFSLKSQLQFLSTSFSASNFKSVTLLEI